LVYKWPDLNIRRYSRAIVNSDETALFVKSGQVVAAMYFVSTREFPGIKFSGRLADILDPVSEQVVALREHGADGQRHPRAANRRAPRSAAERAGDGGHVEVVRHAVMAPSVTSKTPTTGSGVSLPLPRR
jgi:hypothetical protein